MTTRRKNIPDDVTAADQVTPTASARPTITKQSKLVRDPLLTDTIQAATAPIVPKRHILVDSGETTLNSSETEEPSTTPARGISQIADDDGFRSVEVAGTSPEIKPANPEPSSGEITVAVSAKTDDKADEATSRLEESEKLPDTTDPVEAVGDTPAPKGEDKPAKDAPKETSDSAIKTGIKNARSQSDDAERQHKIDQLIASQTYFVPINAVARRRSRITTVLLLLFALALLVALADLLLDVGLIHYNFPHTHFF